MKEVPALLGFVLGMAACLPCARAQSSFHQAGYLYLSPVPNASYVSDQTRDFLVRFEEIRPTQVTNLATDFIQVVGQVSGLHPGSTRVATDGRTVIFETGLDFATNELVTVSLNPKVVAGTAGNLRPFQYAFMVTAPMAGPLPLVARFANPLIAPDNSPAESKISTHPSAPRASAKARSKIGIMANGVTVPSDFPQIVITVNSNPSPGYLFLENGLDGVPPYTMIVDNNGLPVWYQQGRMYDFKIQKNGMITWCLSDDTGFPAFDQNFNYLKTYLATNGYSSDGHELKIQPDGTYFMIGYRNNAVDLSQYYIGGDPGAIVRETVVQEFTAAGDLILQWRAWDNYDIADQPNNADFPHMNGIDIDEDGNILVSARHLSEVTKIDSNSGEIIWRLSGAHSTFSFPNDPFDGTSFQHNISALGNGHYMVFDNGNYHVPQSSRAVEYQLDLTHLTATMAWEFRDTPDAYTYWQGSAQRLPTGNTLIDFVQPQYPKATEVDTNGIKHFELSMVPEADSYRAFRLPWSGVVAAPYLIIEPESDNTTLIFNKFGDTNVAYYRIYGGLALHPTSPLYESQTTYYQISNLPNGIYYFRVTAVSNDGVESPFSNEESVNINILPAGANLVSNGDFSQGTAGWVFNVDGGASASFTVSSNAAQVLIANGGSSLSGIQLLQSAVVLSQGKRYVLEFDAWSSQPTYVDVNLAQSVSPYTQYSPMITPFLTPNRAHYLYSFIMQRPSDDSANLLFNIGGAMGDVYLANISLFNPPVGDLNLDGRVDFLDLNILTGNWLRQQASLPGDLNGDNKVDFNDFSILGQNWSPGGP